MQSASIPIFLSTIMRRLEKEEIRFLSRFEQHKLHHFYMQMFAASGLVCNLVKAAKLSPTKVIDFLHSKSSYTRFTQATRKFKRIRAFARFKLEIWCMDLAYGDKLAEHLIGVKFLPVCKNLFDRTEDDKRMKTKDSKEAVKTFSSFNF